MNKTTKILIVLILTSTSLHKAFSQEITEENFLKIDKEISEDYEHSMSEISSFYELHPEKIDSLLIVSAQIEKMYHKKLTETTIKFASVPSGFDNLYRQRLMIPKDVLLDVLGKSPKEMQESDYGKSIKFHIDSKQIEIGDDFYNFQATDSDGTPFQLSSLKGKDIFLLYGGLGCIQENGRALLKNFHNTMDKDNFKIVVFNSSSNIEELNALKTQYQLDFIFVDDFKKDHSPMKIIYGAQSTPTCFVINKSGIVTNKFIGLPENELNKLKKASR